MSEPFRQAAGRSGAVRLALPGEHPLDHILDPQLEPLELENALPIGTGPLLLMAQRFIDAGVAFDQAENA